MGTNRVKDITKLLDKVAEQIVELGGDSSKSDMFLAYKNKKDGIPVVMRDFFEAITFDIFIVRAWASVKEYKELKNNCDFLLAMITNHQNSRRT